MCGCCVECSARAAAAAPGDGTFTDSLFWSALVQCDICGLRVQRGRLIAHQGTGKCVPNAYFDGSPSSTFLGDDGVGDDGDAWRRVDLSKVSADAASQSAGPGAPAADAAVAVPPMLGVMRSGANGVSGSAAALAALASGGGLSSGAATAVNPGNGGSGSNVLALGGSFGHRRGGVGDKLAALMAGHRDNASARMTVQGEEAQSASPGGSGGHVSHTHATAGVGAGSGAGTSAGGGGHAGVAPVSMAVAGASAGRPLQSHAGSPHIGDAQRRVGSPAGGSTSHSEHYEQHHHSHHHHHHVEHIEDDGGTVTSQGSLDSLSQPASVSSNASPAPARPAVVDPSLFIPPQARSVASYSS